MKDQEGGGEREKRGIKCEDMGFLPGRWLGGWRRGNKTCLQKERKDRSCLHGSMDKVELEE